jgi:hypothetical protein
VVSAADPYCRNLGFLEYISHYVLITVSGPVSIVLHAIPSRFPQTIHESQTVAVLTSLEAVPSVDQVRRQCSSIL